MSAQLALVNEAAAWEILTSKQRMVLRLAALPTARGNDRSVRGLCQGLGISPRAFYRTLERARANFERMVAMVERGDLA